ncbi:Cytochrome b5 domain-containing protein 1 [Argiope bruennichi]|uniref:Cytochrome b5 domain-containing protein 1 n=1 Tax=Argiope bruennichi TaxID=94029 RepID=A0A8T0FZ53_ARGBR|nr:Cytochrome b5 domain-containing protein 1 [Argiope bruennichi]
MSRPKYFTRREVSIHNQEGDLWVILFQKVLDLSSLPPKPAVTSKDIEEDVRIDCFVEPPSVAVDVEEDARIDCFVADFEDNQSQKSLTTGVVQDDMFALLAFGGKDIDHLFDADGQVKFHINPETQQIDTFSPFRKFIDMPTQERVEEIYLKKQLQDKIMVNKIMERFDLQRLNKDNSNFNATKVSKDVDSGPLPWWKDEKYVIGLLTAKSRWIRIRNMLTHKSIVLEVCSEETIDEILLRYLKFNNHARSYTWKHHGQNLLMSETLETNGIHDVGLKAEKLRINDDDYIPTLDLYFNDDLTEA